MQGIALNVNTISIHAARVGCDLVANCLKDGSMEFQSTQPEWAATEGGEDE
mgnify:FL=1